MKIKIWIWLILLGLAMTACFEDESAKDITLPNPIRINDFFTSEELYVTQGGRLKITTLSYKEDTDDSNLKFLWTLRGQGRYDTLGHSMILDTIVNVPISREAYSLLYTVTDTVMDLKLSKRYFLFVTGEYEAGLLVADTRDEQTSDLHLVVGLNFTQNYKDHDNDHNFMDIYSINNGGKVDGLITGMTSLVFSGYLQTNIATKNSIQRLNPLKNFKVTARNNEMFVKPFEGEIEVGKLDISERGSADVAVINGHIHKRLQYDENVTFGVKMLLEDLTDDYYITQYKYRASSPYPSEGDIFGVAFDKKHQRFLAFPFFRQEDNLRIFKHTSMNGKLDPNRVGNKECVYIGHGANVRMYAVLKDNESGKYEIWAFNLNSDDDVNRPDIIPEYYDLSACTDIGKAHSFGSQTMEEVMYYATDDHVYAALLTSEHPQVVPCYDVNAGEKITGIRLVEYCPGQMEIPNAAKPGTTKLSTARNHMLLVYTYNEKKEGKVIAVPILSLSTGNLMKDKTYHREYGPFGRILGTTCYHTR